MLTPDEIAARQVRIDTGLEHRGNCQQVFTATGHVCNAYGRLLKCNRNGCDMLICFGCRVYHGIWHKEEDSRYVDFYTDVIAALTAGGYAFPKMGGLLPEPVLRSMYDASIRRESSAEFALWLLRERDAFDERENMGNETISPKDAEIAA